MTGNALALWTALFSIAGLVIGWFFGRSSGRRESLVTSDLALAAAAPPSLYRVEELACSIRFDEEGDGIYIRRELGIQPISDLQEIVVPYRFSVTPQGSLQQPEIKSLSPEVLATWRASGSGATSISGTILLRGALGADSRAAGYELSQGFRKAFFMSKEETVDAYRESPMKLEYIGVAAYVPTRLLRCSIEFPPSHRSLSSGPSACAFVGETEFVNETETTRLKDSLQVEAGRASLEVENPRPGLRYAVTWLAPSRR